AERSHTRFALGMTKVWPSFNEFSTNKEVR
ncbi:unnamed protein product, partial [marine sediment metagenome]